MLYEGKSMEHYISTLLPFKAENKIEVLKKVQLMVRSNAIGIPLLAIIQGFISLGGYLICDAPNPFLSAMLTAFASVIPLVGTALVWVPITIYFLIVGSWVNALMMLGYGAIPLSVILIKEHPPSLISIVIADAPASMAFSTNSFITDAGRCITSPAAI